MNARKHRPSWQLIWTLAAASACGGRLVVDSDAPGGGSAVGGAGLGGATGGIGSGGIGGTATSGGGSSASSGGTSQDAGSTGGTSGSGGTSSTTGGTSATGGRSTSNGGTGATGGVDSGTRQDGAAGAPTDGAAASCTDGGCGGPCAPCSLGGKCVFDADCQSYACDFVSKTCIADQCADHREDGNESDADCGGGTCKPCMIGQFCTVNTDCISGSCDYSTFQCVSNSCVDHHQDGNETGIDCGGGVCSCCIIGRSCTWNADCCPGHLCNGSKVCQ